MDALNNLLDVDKIPGSIADKTPLLFAKFLRSNTDKGDLALALKWVRDDLAALTAALQHQSNPSETHAWDLENLIDIRISGRNAKSRDELLGLKIKALSLVQSAKVSMDGVMWALSDLTVSRRKAIDKLGGWGNGVVRRMHETRGLGLPFVKVE